MKREPAAGTRKRLFSFYLAEIGFASSAALLLLILTGCSWTLTGGARPNPKSDLRPFVNQTVTVHGRYIVEGKIGPFIQTTAGSIYLLSNSQSPGPSDSRLEREKVRATGVLRFRHFPRVSTTEPVDVPYDYFYFDAATTKIVREYREY